MGQGDLRDTGGGGKEHSPGVYFWDISPVFHMYPACISPYP